MPIISPLIYAALLFLTIRLANDLPEGSDYLAHSPAFIAIETGGIIAGSYLCFYLARKWANLCATRHLAFVAEYGPVTIVPAALSVAIMYGSHQRGLSDNMTLTITPTLITVLMSLWLYLTFKSIRLNELYTASLINEKTARQAAAEAQLRLLRSQYHPHFLFNMLNTIYFSISEDNPQARSTVEHLANLLRSQLYESDNMIAVAREISAIESYTELYRLRHGDRLEISLAIDHRFDSAMIHPHMLMPLVENAFKHSGGTPWRVAIKLTRTADTLEFQVDNTLPAHTPTESTSPASGIGLANLKKRLEILYGNKGQLTVKTDGGVYSARIYLQL
ncbi:MAG: histidine kinase [Muribaculaceae bacterium]|nr:histidine kinase [Muribaculaceae bacterium]